MTIKKTNTQKTEKLLKKNGYTFDRYSGNAHGIYKHDGFNCSITVGYKFKCNKIQHSNIMRMINNNKRKVLNRYPLSIKEKYIARKYKTEMIMVYNFLSVNKKRG